MPITHGITMADTCANFKIANYCSAQNNYLEIPTNKFCSCFCLKNYYQKIHLILFDIHVVHVTPQKMCLVLSFLWHRILHHKFKIIGNDHRAPDKIFSDKWNGAQTKKPRNVTLGSFTSINWLSKLHYFLPRLYCCWLNQSANKIIQSQRDISNITLKQRG